MTTAVLSLVALLGLLVLLVGRVRLGKCELRPPYSTMAGALLMLPLPIGLWAAFATGWYGVTALGRLHPVSNPGWVLSAAPLAAMVCTALAVAVVALGLVAGRDEERVPSNHPRPIVPSDVLERAPTVSTGIRTCLAPAWNTNFPKEEVPPPSRPMVPSCVLRVMATGDGLPPEIEALGKATKLYRAGLMWCWLMEVPSYVVYPDALVIAQGDEYTIIPWKTVEVFHQHKLTLEDGQTFTLSGSVIDAGRLRQAIRSHCLEHLAARAVEQIERGERAVFGPFAVDSEGLVYRGKRAEWNRIQGLDSTGVLLFVEVRGFMMPWQCPLEEVPNAFVLLETIKRTCPKRLLEAES